MIDELVSYNREFVKNKGYEKYITNKYPDKKMCFKLFFNNNIQ